MARGGDEERSGVMASFQLFAQRGPGHLGNTNPAAKERKTRDYKGREREGGRDRGDGKQGRRAGPGSVSGEILRKKTPIYAFLFTLI